MNPYKLNKSRMVCFIIIVLCSMTAIPYAWSAGFAVNEKTVSGLGNAYAGGAAIANDPSTIYSNAAGMTRLSGHQLEAGVSFITFSADFENKGSTHASGAALSGNNNIDGGTDVVVPSLYYSHKLNDSLALGIGSFVAFGLKTTYDRNWVGRYHAVDSEIATIDINPSMAYRINDKFSIGAGIDIQRIDATLSNAVDFGLIEYSLYQNGLLSSLSTSPQTGDGFAELKGDDISYGFNIGVLFELSPQSRVGASYRSGISHKVIGQATFEYPNATIEAIAKSPLVNLSTTQASAEVELPPIANISAYHRITKNFALMGDVTWTGWSSLEELRIKFANGASDSVLTLEWKDAYRFSLGGEYLANDKLTFRIGTAYDQTPVPNAQRRTPRVPDEDRIWLSLGCGYAFNKTFTVNFGYAHLWMADDPEIDKSATGEDQLKGGLKGTYSGGADIFGLNLVAQF